MISPRVFKRKFITLIILIIAYFNPALAHDIRFYRLFKQKPNYKNPELFAEKTIVRMKSKANEKLADYVDKWKVREYVEEVIGSDYHIPILAVYDAPEKVRYDLIPEGAYIKLNHASGYNTIYTKSKEKKIRRKIKKWYRSDFSKLEMQYKNVERKILVEENLIEPGQILRDFSFFTFHGRVEFVQIRDNAHHRFEVGRNYEKLPYQLFSFVTETEPRTPEFDIMVELAEKLARPFDFVRVDFFVAEGKIYFGELTFSPGAGLRRFTPFEYNKIFGDML